MNRSQIVWSAIAFAGTSLVALSTGFSAAHAEELRVLNWNGYGTDEKFAIQKFKEMTGVTVVHDYFTSNQEMLTKLRTSPGVYDVVLVQSPYLPAAGEEGLIEPIDTSKITSFGDISAQFKDDSSVTSEGKVWGIPWVWGINSFAYNTDAIKDNITSINGLWDPKYKGRVALRDDGGYNVQIAALALGQDINNPDLKAVKEKLLALKPQLRTFWSSEDEWMKGMAAKNFDVGEIWAGGAARAIRQYKMPLVFVIPQEGAAAWLDTMAIAKDAPHKEAAEKFISYMTSPDFYTAWNASPGSSDAVPANAKAVEALPDDAFTKAVMGKPDVVKRLKFARPLTEERRQEISDLWSEVKTEFAQ